MIVLKHDIVLKSLFLRPVRKGEAQMEKVFPTVTDVMRQVDAVGVDHRQQNAVYELHVVVVPEYPWPAANIDGNDAREKVLDEDFQKIPEFHSAVSFDGVGFEERG